MWPCLPVNRKSRCIALVIAVVLTVVAGLRTATAQDTPPEFKRVSDAASRIAIEAPATWDKVAEADWVVDRRVVGAQMTATPDLTAFNTDWAVPGVIVSYSEVLPAMLTLPEVLDQVDLAGTCRNGGRQPFTTGALTGYIQRWEGCGGTTTTATVAALTPTDDPRYYAILEIYTTGTADQPLAERILASFLAPATAPPAPATPTGAEVPPIQLETPAVVGAPPSEPGLAYAFASRRDPAVVALLPETYNDVASEPWLAVTGEPLGYMLAAAPDLAAFRTTWTTPGIVVRTALSLTKTLDAADLLADSDLLDACTAVERSERVHATPVFTYNLLLDTYSGCGGASTYTLAVAQSDPIDHLVFLEFQAIGGADSAALDIFLESFAVDRAANAGAAAATEAAASALAAPTPAPTPTPVLPTGIVLANNLNVRSGPGTEFERLGAAPQGAVLPVAGQLGNCTWLRVTAPNNLEGWVSGEAAFITLDTPCAAIPEVQP